MTRDMSLSPPCCSSPPGDNCGDQARQSLPSRHSLTLRMRLCCCRGKGSAADRGRQEGKGQALLTVPCELLCTSAGHASTLPDLNTRDSTAFCWSCCSVSCSCCRLGFACMQVRAWFPGSADACACLQVKALLDQRATGGEARYVELTCGHVPMDEQPQEFLQALKPFLEDVLVRDDTQQPHSVETDLSNSPPLPLFPASETSAL